MRTANNSRTLMTPGSTASDFSEAMPTNPHNGDEVIAINVGETYTYTVTGNVLNGPQGIGPGGSIIFVYCGAAVGWVATWNSAGGGAVTFPISIAHGGTGIDGTNLLGWASTTGDSATTTMSLSATDTNLNKSTVSLSIELPGDGASPGTLVGYVGATDAVSVSVGDIQGILTVSAPPGLTSSSGPPSNIATISLHGFRASGDAVDGGMSTIDFNSDETIGIGGGGTAGVIGPLFVTTSSIAAGVDPNTGLFALPEAMLHVRDFNHPQAFLSESLTGISALFRTSATDGSNANATVVARANTAQVAPSDLLQAQAQNGTILTRITPVTGSVGWGSDGFLGNNPQISLGPGPAALGEPTTLNFQVADGSTTAGARFSILDGFTDDSNFFRTTIDSGGVQLTAIGTFAGPAFMNFGITQDNAISTVALQNGGSAFATLKNDGSFDVAALSGAEHADFAAPAANTGILYFKDIGGKTALVARFPTGAVQQVAIEP